MKKVLVTGGGGFLGSALVKRLVGMGITPVVLGRQTYPELERIGAVQFRGDIRDTLAVSTASNGCDTIFHVAAKAGVWGSRREYFSTNCEGTASVIRACQVNSIPRLVYTSTPSVVFDGVDIDGGTETLPYGRSPLCHYAETKIMAEKMVLEANGKETQTVALRPHLIWGPGDTNLIPRLVERGMKGLIKQVGDGRNMVDISYIDNVVDAHILAAQNLESVTPVAAGKAYFISQGKPVALWSWIAELFALLHIPPPSRTVSFRKAYVAGKVLESLYRLFRVEKEPLMTRFVAEQLAKSHWFSIASAHNDFGYSPRISTEVGMKRLVEWVRQQEWFGGRDW